MHRHSRTGPVAHLDFVRGADLVHVVDDPPVGNGQPCDLACGRRQLDEMRPRHPHQVPRRDVTGRQIRDPRPQPVAGPARLLLDGAFVPQRGQQARGGALRHTDPLGDLGHADRAIRESGQHGERALDGLDSGHVGGPELRSGRGLFHYTAPFRIAERPWARGAGSRRWLRTTTRKSISLR